MGDVPSVLPTPKKITLEEWRQQQASRLPPDDARSSSSRTARQEERGEKRGRARSRGSASPSRRRRLDEMEDRRRDSDLRERAGRSDYSNVAKDEGRDRGYDSRRPSDTVAGSRSLDGRERGRGTGWDRRGEAYVAQVEERPSRGKRDEHGQERDSGYRRPPFEDRDDSSSTPNIHPHPPTGPSNHAEALDSRHQRPPPPRPQPGDDVPYELTRKWSVIFVRQIPDADVGLVDGFAILSSLFSTPPVAVKTAEASKSSHLVYAFVAFESREDARVFQRAAHGALLRGQRLDAYDSKPPCNSDGTPKTTGEKIRGSRLRDRARPLTPSSLFRSVAMALHHAQVSRGVPSPAA